MFGKSIFKNYSNAINIFSRFSDLFIVVAAAFIAFGIRFSFDDLNLPKDYKLLVLFSFFCVALIFPMFNLYSSWRGQSLFSQAKSIITAWGTVVLCMIVILFGMKMSSDYSRLWLLWWAILGLFFLLSTRMLIYAFLQTQRKKGKNIRHVIVVGAGQLGQEVIEKVTQSSWTGFKIDAVFDDNEELLGHELYGVGVAGDIAAVNVYLSDKHTDEVWIALPLYAENRIKELLHQVRHHTVNIKLIPDIFGFSLFCHSVTEIAGLPAVNLSDSPMKGVNLLFKSLEDYLLSIIILLLISPLLIIIAITIKATSKGPVLFTQKRHGWDGTIITVYKFRTMMMHSEDSGDVTQAKRNDSRVTKIGAFLRKTSLDELPQFLNVLQGRMSIVGPRPHAVEHNEYYKNHVYQYMRRHMVKPGITGWAQINGLRGETDTLDKMERRVEYDLFYIENWSLWFDFKIILLTIIKGFVNKNAY